MDHDLACGVAIVSARFLMVFFDAVYLVALSAWVGSILFFSFAVAPLIFNVRGGADAGRLARVLLPRFYTWGAIAGAIALPAFVAVPLSFPEYRGPAIAASAFIILGCILIMLYGANSLTPELTAATDAGPGATGRLRRLQRRSTFLNATVLLAGIGLLIAHANRPAPHTAGIRQLSPEEMARVDSELAPIIEQIEIKYGFRPGPAGAGRLPSLPALLSIPRRSRRSNPITSRSEAASCAGAGTRHSPKTRPNRDPGASPETVGHGWRRGFADSTLWRIGKRMA